MFIIDTKKIQQKRFNYFQDWLYIYIYILMTKQPLVYQNNTNTIK